MNMYNKGKKYEVGEQIKTVDELMSVSSAFIVSDSGKCTVTHRGWYGGWKLKTAVALVESGCVYHRKEVKK